MFTRSLSWLHIDGKVEYIWVIGRLLACYASYSSVLNLASSTSATSAQCRRCGEEDFS
jgi:hypothetical protein